MRVSAPAPARAMRRAAPGRGSAAEQRALLRLGVQRTASSLSLSRARVLRARAAGQGPPRPRVRVCVWGRITAGKAVLLFRSRAGPPSPALFPSGAGSFPAAPVAWRPTPRIASQLCAFLHRVLPRGWVLNDPEPGHHGSKRSCLRKSFSIFQCQRQGVCRPSSVNANRFAFCTHGHFFVGTVSGNRIMPL